MDWKVVTMQVQELMNRDVAACRSDQGLEAAARIMWEHDCGVVPIVDDLERVIGLVTDRDICMAAYTQGRRLSEITVASVMSKRVHTCSATDSIEHAELLMREHRVRRLPVTDGAGRLRGLLSLSDLARHLHLIGTPATRGLDAQGVSLTLEAVSQPNHHITALASHANDSLSLTTR